MTYDKKRKSYKKGRGTSRRLSFDGSLLRALPTFIFLVSGLVFVAVNLDLKSLLFPQNKTELNENIVEEIEENTNIETEEVIEEEIETIKEVESDEEVFTIVEEMPRFPGCEDLDVSTDEKKKCAEKKMLEFIYKNIKYPSVDTKDFEGMTVVSFVVNKEGNIVNLKLLKGDETLGEEYMQVVKFMPQWISGKQRGEPVNVRFNLPVRIKLES